MDSMTRCSNGHFYDATKGDCPTCTKLAQGSVVAAGPTRPVRPEPSDLPPTRPVAPPNPASNPTRAIWPDQLQMDPIVGWLVAYDGRSAGSDFRLRSGRMRIGRGDNMDVQIDDPHVSRENHAFIIFDPVHAKFLLQPGGERGLVYLSRNKQKPELVVVPLELHPYDVIVLGKTKLFFVPFCGPDTFQWHTEGTGGARDPWDHTAATGTTER